MSKKTIENHLAAERLISVRSLLIAGIAAAALAGCATPDYPIKQGYAPPPPIKPQYPIDKKDQGAIPPTPTPPSTSDDPPPAASAPQSASDSAAQTESAPSTTTAAPAPGAVESAPLAPISTAPPPPPTATTAVSTPPSAGSPAPASPPPVSTAPAATTPASVGPQPAASVPVATTAPAATTTPTTPAPAPAATPPPKPAYQTPAYTPPAYEPPKPVRRTETRVTTDGKVVAARGMYRDYLVREGDHLDAIARDLETTREELIRANRLRKPYRIHPGEHIRVPVAKAYVAQSSDSLGGIAKRFGVSLNELADLNDLPAHGRLTPGMYIALPEHFEDHGPSRETIEVAEYERPATTYRPQASYQTANRAPAAPTYVPGTPYTPSAEALAAANARREALNRPTATYPVTRPSAPPDTPVDVAKLASLGVGKFIWPVKGNLVSAFGASGMGRRNDGVDIGAPEGSEVRAAAVGEVVYAGDQVPGFGNLVLIKHAGGWVSAYAHLAQVDVHMRDTVYQGQQIGTVGETGGAGQPELHFELRYAATPEDKAKPLDPLLILPK